MTETDKVFIPLHHGCTLFNPDDPDNGIIYNSALAQPLAYYHDGEYWREYLMKCPNGTFVVQEESMVGVQNDSPRITACRMHKQDAAERYCSWVHLVPPMETGLFIGMKEA